MRFTFFLIVVPFSPKYVTSIFHIFIFCLLICKQQGSDTLEAVNCWSSHGWIEAVMLLLYLFNFANKRKCFSTLQFCVILSITVIMRHVHQGAETPLTQSLRKPEQNTIFIHYVHYIQCNTTGFLHIHCIHRVVLTDLIWVPALKLLSPSKGVERRARWKKETKHILSSKYIEDIYPKIAKKKGKKVVFGIVFFVFTKGAFNCSFVCFFLPGTIKSKPYYKHDEP